MKKDNIKILKNILIIGGVAISIILVAMIANKFQKTQYSDIEQSESISQSQEVFVEIPTITEENISQEDEDSLNENSSPENTVTEQPLQEEVKQPVIEVPTEKQPTKEEIPTENTDKEKEPQKEERKPQPQPDKESQDGAIRENPVTGEKEVYIAPFGWLPEPKEAVHEHATGMGTGDKIGH